MLLTPAGAGARERDVGMFYAALIVMLLMAERFVPLALVVLVAGMLTWMVGRVKRYIRPSFKP